MDVLIEFSNVIIFFLLVLIGYAVGSFNERRHFRSIRRREVELGDLLAFSARHPPADYRPDDTALVIGSAVMSVDYFKTLLALLRNIFGGRVGAYESLVERARREAILRLKAAARERGADYVFNLRLETARVFRGDRNMTISVEVMAYGTACRGGGRL